MGLKLKIIIEFAKIVIQFYLKIIIDMPSPLSKGAHILNPEVAGLSQLNLKKKEKLGNKNRSFTAFIWKVSSQLALHVGSIKGIQKHPRAGDRP